MKSYWLDHTRSLDKWYLGTKVFQQHVRKLGKEKNVCCFFNWRWKFEVYVGLRLRLHAHAHMLIVIDVVYCVYSSFGQPNKFLDPPKGCLMDNLIYFQNSNAGCSTTSLFFVFVFVFYPAGGPAGSCILLVSSFFFFFLLLLLLLLLSSSSFFFFFLLATHLFHTLPYIWFWPNLLTVTGTLTTTHTLKMVGSGVTMGSLGSKRSFSPKTHQVLQIT